MWVDRCLARCSDDLTSHFVQFVSWLLSCKVFWWSHITFHPVCESTIVLQGVVEFLTISHHISSSWWVDRCLARCCWISDHLTSHFIQKVSRLLSSKVLLNFWPSHITFHPVRESTIALQGVVEFLTISNHISSSWWVDHCLARCCWISDHLTSHFIQKVSRPLSRKVLLNFWPSHITFHPVCESTIASQGVVEFLTISHHISSSLWVDHCLARCCWISDHLTSHFIQKVGRLLSCKVLLNFWPPHIAFCPVCESIGWISDHLTLHFVQSVSWLLSCKVLLNFWPSHILSSLWVNHRLARCCWISDHLTSHSIQSVSPLLSCKVSLNFWPSCIPFHPGGVSIVITSCLVIFLTIQQILSRKWVRLVDAPSSSAWLPFTTGKIHVSTCHWPLFQCWYISFSILIPFPKSGCPFHSHQHGLHLQVCDSLHVETFCFSQH